MRPPRTLRVLALTLAAVAAVPASSVRAQQPDSATFVTRLGNDTLAVERMVRTATHVRAEVVLRTPRTEHTVTELALGVAARGLAAG